MKICDPLSIEVSTDVSVLLEELSAHIEELNVLRDRVKVGTTSESGENFDLMVNAVHDSAAIEGLAGERRETRKTLERIARGLPLGKEKRQSQVASLYAAVQKLGAYIRDDEAPSCETLCFLHQTLCGEPKGPMFSPPGSFRKENVVIHLSDWLTPDHTEVASLMLLFAETLNAVATRLDPVVLATWAHHVIAQVHPFMDGNGRAARLFQDHVLWWRRYCPGIIEFRLQKEYYSALDEADKGDLNPLLRVVASACLKTCTDLQVVYGAKLRRGAWAKRLATTAESHYREKRSIRYHRWKGRMEDLRDAFAAGAEALMEADLPVSIQLRSYPILSEPQWNTLSREGRKSGNWLFTVSFYSKTVPMVLYIFSFGRQGGWRGARAPKLHRLRPRLSPAAMGLPRQAEALCSSGHSRRVQVETNRGQR